MYTDIDVISKVIIYFMENIPIGQYDPPMILNRIKKNKPSSCQVKPLLCQILEKVCMPAGSNSKVVVTPLR